MEPNLGSVLGGLSSVLFLFDSSLDHRWPQLIISASLDDQHQKLSLRADIIGQPGAIHRYGAWTRRPQNLLILLNCSKGIGHIYPFAAVSIPVELGGHCLGNFFWVQIPLLENLNLIIAAVLVSARS